MLKILSLITLFLFSASAMAFKPGTGIIEKNWVACDDLSTAIEAIMLLATDLDEFKKFIDKNGEGCFVTAQRSKVKVVRQIGDFAEFKMNGIDKNLFTLRSGLSH